MGFSIKVTETENHRATFIELVVRDHELSEK